MHFTLVTPDGEADAMVPMPGRHNVANALAAATLALACGASLDHIVVGLPEAGPVAGRLVRHRLPGAVVMVDESYNANQLDREWCRDRGGRSGSIRGGR